MTMKTDTDRTALFAHVPASRRQGEPSRLLQRIEDVTIFCAFLMALSFMATSAVMVVYS
jgi:hypothetical protein